MPKLNLTIAKQIKGPMGEIRSLKGQGLSWTEAAFSPLSLFANNEQGVWYDPSDLTTMFQDHLGTIPAAYGQPVGLMLDKSMGGFGPELVAEGSFGNSAAGNVIAVGDALVFTNAPLNETGRFDFNRVVPSGTLCLVNFTVTNYVSGSLKFRVQTGGIITVPIAGNGDYSLAVTAGAGTGEFVYASGLTTLTVSNISVREIPGIHAPQPTVTARPTLMQDAGGRAYLYRDLVDDVLPWTAPAGSYDIVHVPLTGPATVLTAQALSGAANILLAETTRGYLAINRRLTGAEITKLQSYYGAEA